MEPEYKKDLSHTTWAKVYRRQEQRAEQAAAWLDALQLAPGDRVADIACGPGYISLLLARRVGPTGVVFAIDRAAEALDYLAERQGEAGLTNIQRVMGDAEGLEPLDGGVSKALVTMMLHHTDQPLRVLQSLARVLPTGGRAVLAEFHPDGPCEVGPPRDHRIAPDQVAAWAAEAGLLVVLQERQSPEHYMLLVERL